MNVITSKVDKKILAASLLSIGLASFPSQGILASETLMNGVQVQQQNTIKVSGVVSDSEGPIIGASVIEKGVKNNGTITDMDGNFQLSVKPGATLVISYMGYKKVEVKAAAGKVMNITMHQDSELLNEVVVVGFGTQKKVNLTGAVDVIDSKQMAERPVSNAFRLCRVQLLVFKSRNQAVASTPVLLLMYVVVRPSDRDHLVIRWY